jgi:hypothetical protein
VLSALTLCQRIPFPLRVSTLIPDVLLAIPTGRLQQDEHSVEFGARRLALTGRVGVEVVPTAADVLAKEIGAGKVVGC